MFGYDDAELERLRRPPRRLRPLVVIAEVLLAAVALVPIVAVDVLYTPEGVRQLVGLAQRGSPFRLDVTDAVFLPTGSWRDPSTWRVLVQGLAFTPALPKAPSWSADRVVVAPSAHRDTEGRWTVALGDAVVSGLHIQAHQQRPPPPWEPRRGVVAALLASTVRIRDASFDAPPDEPLGPVHAAGLVGSFRDLRFDPGRREVSAEGSVRATSLLTGAIVVRDIDLPVFRLDRSSLHVEGSFTFAEAPGTVVGDIARFHVRSEVDLSVALDRLSLARAVETATGRPGPLDGRLGLRLRVRAGGELPRGGSIVEGSGTLREGRIQLGPRTRYVVLDLLTLAPWVDVGPDYKVILADMKGRIRFQRGLVSLMELTYPAGERTIRLDGSVSKGRVHTLVRLLPRKAESTRPGLGLVLEGGGDEGISVRLASKDDVARETPWLPPNEAELAVIEARREARRQALLPKRMREPATAEAP